ncbi:MAG: hypothetical protein OEY29_02510 [Gammaproteobacteria bacterium]|nr:hypothetical protein [Gammaproteobacteria bacterium]
MIKKALLIISLTIVAAYNLTIIYVDNNIQNKSQLNIYDDCHKVWSARGVYENHAEQNSLISLKRAFLLGSKGAEIDLYYDVKTNDFIISHDRPKTTEEGELAYTLKEGEVLTLERVFKETGHDHYFWLDYKNLDRLSSEQTSKAIARLLSISAENSIRERIYLEGSNPLIVSKYTDAGFKTILGIHPPYESSLLSNIAINIYKMAYYFNNITAIAMSYGLLEKPYYGSQAEKNLEGLPVFLFHVPDNETLIKRLLAKKEVKVVLAGRDVSLNRADLTACEK